MSDIKNKLMLASLCISVWTGRRFDDRATEVVEKNYQTKKVGRFNKDLLPQKPESFLAVRSLASQLRALFQTYTLDYQQLGVRLLTTDVYEEWTMKLRQHIFQFDNAVSTFLSEYPQLKEDAKIFLRRESGSLFLENDYLTVDQLKTKFGVKFSVLPFPDAEHFGVALPEADLAIVKQDLNENVEKAVTAATLDLQKRLFEAIYSMAQGAARDGRFYESTITNLKEIIHLMPKLNFAQDTRLNEIANLASKQLTVFDATAIRSSPSVRSDVAGKAEAIALTLADYMGLDQNIDFDAPIPASKPMGLLTNELF